MEKTNTNNWIDGMEFLGEWKSDLTYKLYRIPRETIDEDSDENDAYNLIGLDGGNVRRIDVSLDTAYGRSICGSLERLLDAYNTAPAYAQEILKPYLAATFY